MIEHETDKDEQAATAPASSDLKLVILIFGISAGFLAASVLFVLIAYILTHAHP